MNFTEHLVKILGQGWLRNVGLGTIENPIPIGFNRRRMHLIFFTEHSVKYVPQAWVIEKCPIGFNRRHIHLNFFTPGWIRNVGDNRRISVKILVPPWLTNFMTNVNWPWVQIFTEHLVKYVPEWLRNVGGTTDVAVLLQGNNILIVCGFDPPINWSM